MKRYLILLFFILLSPGIFSQDYTDLTTTLTRWSGVMTRYTKKISDCKDLDRLNSYCTELADTIGILSPDLKAMHNKYPEIAQNEFPEVLSDYLKKHMEVSESFGQMVNELTKKANEIPDNESYQEAFGKLNLALYMMLR